MDVRKNREETEDGPWETGQRKSETEKRTRRQRKTFAARDGSQTGEVNHGKVLRSHTRRNTEKTAATEWVSSRHQQPPQPQRFSAMKRDGEAREADDVDEPNRGKEMGGAGTAELTSVISLSSPYEQPSNERKIPPEQAELGGTTSKQKATIEDVQTGSSSLHKGSTIGEVGRARKSKRNEASLLQSSSCSVESAPTSHIRPNTEISQHSKWNSIVGTATTTTDDDDDASSLQRTCSVDQMSQESARRSPKESICSYTSQKQITTGREETRFELKETGGSVCSSSHWSPPANSSDQSEHDEEKEDVFRESVQDDEDELLATSLKTLACGGQSETKFQENFNPKSSVSISVCSSSTETTKELATGAGQLNKAKHQQQLETNDNDDEEEWQVAPHNHDEGKYTERNLREKEKPRIVVVLPCRRSSSTMIQGGVEITPAGTEAPEAALTLTTTSSLSPPDNTLIGSTVSSPSKRKSASGLSKKRSVSDRVNEPPPLFKFKKPQQNKKNIVGDSDDKSDNVVLGAESPCAELLRSVVEPKKAQVSSVLMSNLPYMGELTFDTRPRRGRKPKKADICHLISKNYGIHFPSNTVQDVHLSRIQESQQRPFALESTQVASTSKTKLGHNSTRSRQVERVGVHQNAAARRSPSSKPLVLPSTVPAFYNRDVSIVPIIPSLWNNTGSNTGSSSSATREQVSSRSGMLDSVSTAHFTLQRNTLESASSQETISMFPLNPQTRSGKVFSQRDSDDANSECSGMDVDVDKTGSPAKDEKDQDMPLNLCLRDDTVGKGSFLETLSLGTSSLTSDLDVRWSKELSRRTNTHDVSSSSEGKSSYESISPSITIIQGGKRSIELSPLQDIGFKGLSSFSRRTTTESESQMNLVSGKGLARSIASAMSRNSNPAYNLPLASALKGVQPQINTSEISISLKNTSMEGMGSTSFMRGREKDFGAKEENVTIVKQTPGGRKKKGTGATSTTCATSKNSSSSAGNPPYSASQSGSSHTLSSLGGRLFGQSSGGINDGAQVSICKFKFTGGAKPSLQEKKMLSVDSGGNFRFYTDKSTNGISTKIGKGHQFAVSPGPSKMKASESATSMGKSVQGNEPPPRSELTSSFSSFPQAGNYPEGETKTKTRKAGTGSSASSLIKSGSKRTLNTAPSISSSTSGASQTEPFSLLPTRDENKYFRLSMDGDQVPASTSSKAFPFQVGEDSNSSSNSCTSSDDDSNENSVDRGNGFDLLPDRGDTGYTQLSQRHFQKEGSSGKLKLRRKRRTRKSLMREKLEKTFKEKGFLIQTQQLESAEGATYCKFRQLRKFTRYLFRSWKDYLPDNVKEISDNSTQAQQDPGNNPPMSTPKSEDRESSPEEQPEHEKKIVNIEDTQEDEIDIEDDQEEGDDVEGGDSEDKAT